MRELSLGECLRDIERLEEQLEQNECDPSPACPARLAAKSACWLCLLSLPVPARRLFKVRSGGPQRSVVE